MSILAPVLCPTPRTPGMKALPEWIRVAHSRDYVAAARMSLFARE
jgi:hypothetical protein